MTMVELTPKNTVSKRDYQPEVIDIVIIFISGIFLYGNFATQIDKYRNYVSFGDFCSNTGAQIIEPLFEFLRFAPVFIALYFFVRGIVSLVFKKKIPFKFLFVGISIIILVSIFSPFCYF